MYFRHVSLFMPEIFKAMLFQRTSFSQVTGKNTTFWDKLIFIYKKYYLCTIRIGCSAMQNIAIILAGGSGKRVGGNLPKQFLKIAGKTILEHTLETFENHPQIDEIAVVVPSDYREFTQSLLRTNTFSKVKHILTGGAERYLSTLAALAVYTSACRLLIHDAVRPLVSGQIITNVIKALDTANAVEVAIPATDTIIEVDPTHTYIIRIPERELLYQVQTPQGFQSQTLKTAYEKALQDPHFRTTDDCGVVRKYLPEEKIYLVPGDPQNIKFTYAGDQHFLEQLLREKRKGK